MSGRGVGKESGRETETEPLLSVSESGTEKESVSVEAAQGQQVVLEGEQEKTWDDFRCST